MNTYALGADTLTRHLYEHVAGIAIYPGIFMRTRPVTIETLSRRYQKAFQDGYVVVGVTRDGDHFVLLEPADLRKHNADFENILSVPEKIWNGFVDSQTTNT